MVRVDLTPAGVTRLGSSPPPCAGHAANHLGLLSAYRVPNAGFGFYNTGGPEWCPFGLNLLGTALATPIQTPTFTLHVNPIVILGPTRSDQCGYTEQVIPVPNDPSLVNASFALQTVWYQFGSPCQNAALLSASDALRIP